MKKALLMTVGTGTRPDTNIVAPLIKSIRNSNPDLVFFLCSNESRKYAEQIATELELVEGKNCEFETVRNPDDLEVTFEDAVSAFRKLNDMGYDSSDISIDFTTGTKAMTSALVLAGIAHNCGTLKYITGEREHGIVIPGTERIITFEPNRIRAYESIELSITFIKELRFDTAIDMLMSINIGLLDEYNKRKREILLNISSAYSHWEKFDHLKARGEFSKVRLDGFPELGIFKPDKETLSKLIHIGESIKSNVITWEILADLYCNAKRRFNEGKHDDALARIYRLTEMIAQMVLKNEYNLDTSDIELSKVPTDLKTSFETLRGNDGKVKIGLTRDYELLYRFNDPLGIYYNKNKNFRGVLGIRNQSILAHGLTPISKEACMKAFEHFKELATMKNPEFDDLCCLLTFPWLKNN